MSVRALLELMLSTTLNRALSLRKASVYSFFQASLSVYMRHDVAKVPSENAVYFLLPAPLMLENRASVTLWGAHMRGACLVSAASRPFETD